jgi:hypothetical protein
MEFTSMGARGFFFQFCDIENLAIFSKTLGNLLKFMVEKTQLIQKLPNFFFVKKGQNGCL